MYQGPLPQPTAEQLSPAHANDAPAPSAASMREIDYYRLAARAHYLRSKMVRDAVGRFWQWLTQDTASPATSR